MSQRRPKQAVHFVTHFRGRQAGVELELDDAYEQRIEGTTGSQKLLSDVRKSIAGPDHSSESRGLTACTLCVTNQRGAWIGRGRRIHGRTKTAPVMPAAA